MGSGRRAGTSPRRLNMPTKELAQEPSVRPRVAAPSPRNGQTAGPSLAPTPVPSGGGILPPSNGQPSVARAGSMVGISATAPDVVARAQMSIGLQRNIGNAGMAALMAPKPMPAA